MESWNEHKIQVRNGPSRSPADFFGFDSLVYGVRGDQLPQEEEMGEEELEVYGVDWEGLREDRLLQSQQENNPMTEGWSSWVGRSGPPDHLNEVPLYSPTSDVLTASEIEGFLAEMAGRFSNSADDADRSALWLHCLGHARSIRGDIF